MWHAFVFALCLSFSTNLAAQPHDDDPRSTLGLYSLYRDGTTTVVVSSILWSRSWDYDLRSAGEYAAIRQALERRGFRRQGVFALAAIEAKDATTERHCHIALERQLVAGSSVLDENGATALVCTLETGKQQAAIVVRQPFFVPLVLRSLDCILGPAPGAC